MNLTMQITIANKITITGHEERFTRVLRARLTFDNPKWIENDRRGFSNYDTPRRLTYLREDEGKVYVPRGYAGQLLDLCNRMNVRYDLNDKRRALPDVPFTFTGTLRDFQADAVDALRQRDFGTLAAPTGSGKTVIGLAVIAERKQPALIVVHTRELLYQWIERIEAFLDIPDAEVGIIGDGKKTIGNKITVALVQSLYKCAKDVAPDIGQLVIDECHRAPSRVFAEAVIRFDCKYQLGLSATPYRRDRLSRLIYWFIGDIRHEIKRDTLEDTGDILKAEVITRETEFRTLLNPSEEYSRMLSELTQDRRRNALIASDVAAEASNGGGICLILSDRKIHCEELQRILAEHHHIDSDVLTGNLPISARKDIVTRLNAGEIKVLIATGQLVGEGFDCRALSTLFLATPIKFQGRVIQYLGRILRPALGKEKPRVYDYVDSNIGVLVASANARSRILQ